MTFYIVVALSFSFEMVGLTPSSDKRIAFCTITAYGGQNCFCWLIKWVIFSDFLVCYYAYICIWNPIGVVIGMALWNPIGWHGFKAYSYSGHFLANFCTCTALSLVNGFWEMRWLLCEMLGLIWGYSEALMAGKSKKFRGSAGRFSRPFGSFKLDLPFGRMKGFWVVCA